MSTKEPLGCSIQCSLSIACTARHMYWHAGGAVADSSTYLRCRYRIVGGIARCQDGSVDYSEDFFSQKAFLTVSGQIQGEYYACALSNIYTFGPTFRAENSHTSRHLAEFWMIEPEMAFCNLQDDMQCAEDYVRFCCRTLLRTCQYAPIFKFPGPHKLGHIVICSCQAHINAICKLPCRSFSQCNTGV